MIGTTIANTKSQSERVFKSINNFVPAFYVLFFTLAGGTLNLKILKMIGLIGVVYIFACGLGKFLGSFFGGLISKAENQVTKYLGLALLPQGGVSIGLSVLVRQQLAEHCCSYNNYYYV